MGNWVSKCKIWGIKENPRGETKLVVVVLMKADLHLDYPSCCVHYTQYAHT